MPQTQGSRRHKAMLDLQFCAKSTRLRQPSQEFAVNGVARGETAEEALPKNCNRLQWGAILAWIDRSHQNSPYNRHIRPESGAGSRLAMPPCAQTATMPVMSPPNTNSEPRPSDLRNTERPALSIELTGGLRVEWTFSGAPAHG